MTDDRLPWFPCEAAKLLGALSAMKPYVGYTYWIVCLRCYEVGGPCPDPLDAIARRTGYNKRVVSDALDTLFRSGKLVREPTGISNPYASTVIGDMKDRRGRLSQSGRKGAQRKWEKVKENQQIDSGPASQTLMAFDAHLQLQEQVQEERKVESPRAKRRAPRAMVPADWTLSQKNLDYAAKLGFVGAKVFKMRDLFVRHHRSRGNLFADFDMAWDNWCDNEVKFTAERAARQNGVGDAPTMFDIAAGNFGGQHQ